jgi:hypothetical protein
VTVSWCGHPPPHTCCASLQIIVRKGYHILAGALFVPAFFWDLPLLCHSLGVAFAALVALEALRVSRVPGLGAGVQAFMQASDGVL